jgi:hypothetical protein
MRLVRFSRKYSVSKSKNINFEEIVVIGINQ